MNCPYDVGGFFSGGTCLSGPPRKIRLSTAFPRARQACPSDPFLRRDPLVGSVYLGGTCLSRPLFNVGSSIPFRRGPKSRAESGAKAPHSIWSAAIYRRFLVKALAFTTLAFTVSCRDHEIPLVGAIHELPLQRRRALFRRDPLVRSATQDSIIHGLSPGTTSVPLRPLGGTRLSRPPFNARSCIAFRRGLKSRAESGAEAPHSIWSAAIYRRFLVKALAFTTLPLIRMQSGSPIAVEPDPPPRLRNLSTGRGNS